MIPHAFYRYGTEAFGLQRWRENHPKRNSSVIQVYGPAFPF